jgi:Peptidase family M28
MVQQRRTASTGSPWLALATLTGVLLVVLWRAEPPAPRPASAPAQEFSAERAHAVLTRLLGDGAPHPVGTAAGAAVRQRIATEFAGLGLTAEVQEAFACAPHGTCATVRNLLVRLPGRESGRAVLFSVHYDSVGAGAGASDDGVGVAALLEIARILTAQGPLRNPVILLVDDGEEAGLLGAEAFAEHAGAREVGAVVNLEARGTSGPSFLFETAAGNAWVARLAASALARPAASSLFYEIYQRMPNDTDFTVWKRAGMQGANFAFVGDVMRYHTRRDDLAHVDRGSLQHHGDNALAMVRAFGEADLAAPPGGNAVFFDVLSAFILWWPTAWSWGLAAVSLLLCGAATRRLARAGLTVGELAWGGLAWLLAPVLALGLAFGVTKALAAAGALPFAWVASSAALEATVWALAVAAALGTNALLVRRSGAAGAWAGGWLCWCLVGLLAAWKAPGASYLFLVPSVAAGLAALTLRGRGEPLQIASLLPAVLTGLLWFPILTALYNALGWSVLPALAALVALVLGTAVPRLTSAPHRGWWPAAAATLAALLLAGVASRAAVRSDDRPEKLNLSYWRGAHTAEALWLAAPESGVLPAALATVAPFATAPSPYPWGRSTWRAVAPALDLPGPEMDILSISTEPSGQRRFRVRLRSPRGAPQVQLALPAVSVGEVLAIGGKPLPAGAHKNRASSDWRFVSVHTVGAEGVEVELSVVGDDFDAQLLDRSYGLPAEGSGLLAALPADFSPVGWGDMTVVHSSVRFAPPAPASATVTAPPPPPAAASR